MGKRDSACPRTCGGCIGKKADVFMVSAFFVEKFYRKDKYGKKSESVKKDHKEGNLSGDSCSLQAGIHRAETRGYDGKYPGVLQYRAG